MALLRAYTKMEQQHKQYMVDKGLKTWLAMFYKIIFSQIILNFFSILYRQWYLIKYLYKIFYCILIFVKYYKFILCNINRLSCLS